MSKKRVTRNTTVGEVETMFGVPSGTITKLSGTDARADMKMGTLAWSLVQQWVKELENKATQPS